MMKSKSLMPKMLKTYDIAPNVFAFSTTRHGGVSKGNYGEFNINTYCGDAPENIKENRKILEEIINVSDDKLIMPHQVHLTRNRVVDDWLLSFSPVSRSPLLEAVDSLATNVKDVCIGVSTADCIPVLLYDAKHHAAAAIHAGWRGTVRRIVTSTVRAMVREYNTNPSDVIAVIGPGISLKNFEVGDEVYDAFAKAGFEMNAISRKFPINKINEGSLHSSFGKGGEEASKWHIDLPLCNQLLLENMGIPRGNILQSGICTFDNVDDFFSARRLGTKSGRIYTGIILR